MNFEISKEQLDKIRVWDNIEMGHECSCIDGDRKYVGCAGGRLGYTFIPTGLGVITEVRCACGAILDITEGWG